MGLALSYTCSEFQTTSSCLLHPNFVVFLPFFSHLLRVSMRVEPLAHVPNKQRPSPLASAHFLAQVTRKHPFFSPLTLIFDHQHVSFNCQHLLSTVFGYYNLFQVLLHIPDSFHTIFTTCTHFQPPLLVFLSFLHVFLCISNLLHMYSTNDTHFHSPSPIFDPIYMNNPILGDFQPRDTRLAPPHMFQSHFQLSTPPANRFEHQQLFSRPTAHFALFFTQFTLFFNIFIPFSPSLPHFCYSFQLYLQISVRFRTLLLTLNKLPYSPTH